MKSKLIRLIAIPNGIPQTTDFKLEEEELPPLQSGELLLKPLYFSVDPYLRAKMSGGHQPPLYAGDIVYSRAVANVIQSQHQNFGPGDYVLGLMEWRDQLVANGSNLSLLHPKEKLSAYLGVLGSTGLSAYFALLDIGKPKPGETIVISGAAGAVGSVAGQIAKIFGCKVIGIVGSDEKAHFVKDTLGFDEAINYKTYSNIADAIASLCSGGVDIYFDNVGGFISDGVISQMNNYGRVVVCGSIASYNDNDDSQGPRLLPLVVFKKLLVQGFLIADYKDRYQEGIIQLQQWLTEGKLHDIETVIKGFDHLPDAFIGLFKGMNEGKMIVKL